jgi:hypothetical protein
MTCIFGFPPNNEKGEWSTNKCFVTNEINPYGCCFTLGEVQKNKCSNRHIRYWRFVLASNSQPGVRVPLGVHKQFAGGMQYFKSYQDKPTKGKQKRFWVGNAALISEAALI